MKRTIRLVHKYLSLALLALWVLQAVTGVLLVFHWELDDWSVAGPHARLDPEQLQRALAHFQSEHPQQPITSIYTSGALSHRFDVLIVDPAGGLDVLRVDGHGTVLRARPADHDFSHIGVFQIATYLHQTLFLHDAGNGIVAVSGVVLLTNVSLGLYQAWPRRRQWRRTLWPFRTGSLQPTVTRMYQWHRALGLLVAIPLLVLIVAGIVRALDAPLDLGARFEALRPPPAVAAAPVSTDVSTPPTLARALETALSRYPRSTLAGVSYPDARHPWYAVRLTQPHDVRYLGTTFVYINSRDGAVLRSYETQSMPLSVRLWDAVYPLHTGEIAGIAGRCLVLLIGLALTVLIGFGLSLYLLRRRGGRGS